jgi:hypothetical protein
VQSEIEWGTSISVHMVSVVVLFAAERLPRNFIGCNIFESNYLSVFVVLNIPVQQ